MVDVIDLVNPPKVWRDKSADISFVPTQRVKEEFLKLGFDQSQGHGGYLRSLSEQDLIL